MRSNEEDSDWVVETTTKPRRPGRALWWGTTPALAAKVAVAVLAVTVAALGVWKLTPKPEPVLVPEQLLNISDPPALRTPSAEESQPPAAKSQERETAGVYVHVAGAVENPGLVDLAQGARVADAVKAAGGPSQEANLDAINLAALAVDGDQIYLPTHGEAPPANDLPLASIPELVNLNTATAEVLQTLPGIGPVMSDRIISWRSEHGSFTQVADLRKVPGIGPTLMGQLADQVTV